MILPQLQLIMKQSNRPLFHHHHRIVYNLMKLLSKYKIKLNELDRFKRSSHSDLKYNREGLLYYLWCKSIMRSETWNTLCSWLSRINYQARMFTEFFKATSNAINSSSILLGKYFRDYLVVVYLSIGLANAKNWWSCFIKESAKSRSTWMSAPSSNHN
jgi:hypothetical protein